jgi:hypothetical protein
MIGSTNFNCDEATHDYKYSGLGTVEVLMDIIRGWVDGNISCFNGNYIDKRKK